MRRHHIFAAHAQNPIPYAENMTQHPHANPSGKITDEQMKAVEYLPFMHPGIRTDELAQRTGLPATVLAANVPRTCHIDGSSRWWKVSEVADLDEWCLVQSDPHRMDPVASEWRKIVGIERGEATVVFTDSFVWAPLPPTHRVLFRAHPLAISGPW